MVCSVRFSWVVCCAALVLVAHAVVAADKPSADAPYLVGRGSADITGPLVGMRMLGYVRPDQIDEGLHLRQFARTFIVADRAGQRRLAIVTTDLQSVTHSLYLSVLDAVRAKLGDAYGLDNTVIAATHTHAVPAGYWHYGADTSLGSPFYQEHFDALVRGIADSIVAAHQDLRPGHIYVAEGEVEGGGFQRSRDAYMQNPESERQSYAKDVDDQMTLLSFTVDGRPVGLLNWHAVHPTSMNFYNKLISSDNKGYAAYAVEKKHNPNHDAPSNGDQHKPERFVAAFAQANCGDVTPNSKLQGEGPGKDDADSTRIIGGRMAQAAERLLTAADEEISGPIDYRQAYVDFGHLTVGDDFTHAGDQSTSPAAYGYSFAAGSTEDGGGQPIFREGMTKQEPFIDILAKASLPLPTASPEMRRGHLPKPILLALGATTPPSFPEVLPVGVARIGQLAIVTGPAEFTTMSGRRFRQAVKQALPGVKYVVVAGYANDYAGYVATQEEYQIQHYEGAATLYGPWTQAAYQQEFSRLAGDLAAGRKSETHDAPPDVRGMVRPTPLETPYDRVPPAAKFGDAVGELEAVYKAGDTVKAEFFTGNPLNGYKPERQYARIERQDGDQWRIVAEDGDWEVRCRWYQPTGEKKPAAPVAKADGKKRAAINLPVTPSTKPYTADDHRLAAHVLTILWEVPSDAAPGKYRVTHTGAFKAEADGQVHEFAAQSRTFDVD